MADQTNIRIRVFIYFLVNYANTTTKKISPENILCLADFINPTETQMHRR